MSLLLYYDNIGKCWLYGIIIALFWATGCSRPLTSTDSFKRSLLLTRHVSFVQWTDPHVFDAGKGRHAEGVWEEELDNWAALHWAVLETNRLVLSEHRDIDFVVITGDFGLDNVRLQEVKGFAQKRCDCPRREPGEQGPIEPVAVEQAASAMARELRALVVKRVYLVPGDKDLCHQDPRDLHRWAEFVMMLQESLQKQQLDRGSSIKESFQPATSIEPTSVPDVVDLTFTLNRLYYTEKDPRILALASGRGVKPEQDPIVPVVNGISLLGLNSAFFEDHEPNRQNAIDKAVSEEIDFVSGRIQADKSYLLFTHIPDLKNPLPSIRAHDSSGSGLIMALDAAKRATKATVQILSDKAPSSWNVTDQARKKWNDKILYRGNILGIFAGHFHVGSRELYPRNFAQAPADRNAIAKLWVAPPLAEKGQWGLPPAKTARGLLLVSVNGDGTTRVSAQDGENVEPSTIWFSTVDQQTALLGDDKLAEARAAELDNHWDDAASKYKDAIGLAGVDSRTRSTALLGYVNARNVMRSWWWQSPFARWLFLYSGPLFYSIIVFLVIVFGYALLRWISALKAATAILKLLIVPRFRGRAVISDTVQLTPDAPVKEFTARLQAEGEEIKLRLLRERENWAAGHITLLAPAASSLDSLVGSIPKVESVNVSEWVKFFVSLLQTFRWTVQTGLAVFPPDRGGAPNTLASGSGKVGLLPDSELSAYAVLQWGWIVKNSWRRKLPVGSDRAAMSDLARELAALILGEAFV